MVDLCCICDFVAVGDVAGDGGGALTSPPSPKGQLDVGKNKPLKYLFGLYVLLVGGFFLMALTTDLIKQSHFF